MATQTLNFTKRTVDALPYSENGRQRYKDSKLPGFFLRVGADKKVYFVEKKINGKPIKYTIGAHNQITTEQARKEAERLIGEIAVGRDPAAEKRAARQGQVTLQNAFEDFLNSRKAGEKPLSTKTVYDYRRLMETVFKAWKAKLVTEISKDGVTKKHKQVGKDSGPALANLAMRFLRSLLNFCADEYEDGHGEDLIKKNPVSLKKKWFPVERRKTTIKADDLPAWWQAVQGLTNTTARDYLIFVLLTGCRKVEGLSLAISEVDLEAKTFTFPDTKNKKPLTLPLPIYLYSVLKKRIEGLEEGTRFVFPGGGPGGQYSEPRKQVKRVVDVSGVAFTLHDLRRHFVTVAESLDLSWPIIKMLVNHSLPEDDVTAGYLVPDVGRLRRPMQKIEDRILTIAGAGKKAKVVPLHHAG